MQRIHFWVHSHFWLFQNSNFNRGLVNDRLNEKAFFVNSADKVPVLLCLVLLFAFVFTFDFISYLRKDHMSVKFQKFMKILAYFKYNFFIRFWMEVYLEVTINSMINWYWYDFSTWYEVLSFLMSAFFLSISLFLLIFSAIFLVWNRDKIEHTPDKLPNYTALFEEIQNK